MRPEAWAFALLLLAAQLGASGGTPEAWLDGTQPWDTTPVKEVDLELRGAGGDGRPAGGASLQWGVVDTVQVAGDWMQAFQDSASTGALRAQWREADFPVWRPAFALLACALYDGSAWTPRAGLAAALEPFDSSLVANATLGAGQAWGLQVGFWTPYVVSMLRLGVEAEWPDGRYQSACPQLLFNAPGDLSLSFGARLDGEGALPPRYLLRLSYQLFSNP